MRSLLVVALVGMGFTATLAADPKEKTVEAKIIGTWKLVKTDGTLPDDHTFEITYKKGGAMVFTRTPKDKDEPKQEQKGKFKTGEPDDKNKLGTIDWTIQEGENERGELSKIIKLTETELVFEDPEGVKETFERVKEEKKVEEKKDK